MILVFVLRWTEHILDPETVLRVQRDNNKKLTDSVSDPASCNQLYYGWLMLS